MRKGAAVDHLGRYRAHCPRDEQETVQDEYRVIMGRSIGFGAPFFVRPFLKRQSTKGKVGARSVWTVCSECGAMLPVDETARNQAAGLGQPTGFLPSAL